MLSLLAFVLAVAPPQSEGLDLPRGTRLGVAWTKESQVHATQRQLFSVQPPSKSMHAELAWLGVWPREAQARADELDVDWVVVVRSASSAATGTATHEYATKLGKSGRVRFTGAESEVELHFVRRGKTWEIRGGWSQERVARPPWSVTVADSGDRQDIVVDPSLQLSELLREGFDAGADYLAGRELWDKRRLLHAEGSNLAVEDSRRLWTLASEGVPHSSATLPRATLARVAAADWATWARRIGSIAPTGFTSGACGWCGGPAPEKARCPCASASALSALIEFTDRILTPIGPEARPDSTTLADGLRGEWPVAALSRVESLQEQLQGIPARDFREADERFEGRAPWPRVAIHVLVVTSDSPSDLFDHIDEDFGRPARDLLVRRRMSPEEAFEEWGVREKLPFAALIGHDSKGKEKPKLLRVVKKSHLDAAALQQLLEEALWGAYGSK